MNKTLAHWNEKYKGDDLVFGTTPNEFLTRHISCFPQRGRILAVGDGEGRNGLWLAEQGFHVFSVDGAPNGTAKAAEQARLRVVADHFETHCVDLLAWDWPQNLFDGVACLHLYFMPDDRPRMHRAMMESLKPERHLVLEVFHPDNVGRNCGGPQLRELCYSAADLKSDFADYDILSVEECEREIKPSSFHNGGTGMVTRIVVRKQVLT